MTDQLKCGLIFVGGLLLFALASIANGQMLAPAAPPRPEVVEISPTQAAMIAAGKAFPGAAIVESPVDPDLMEAAREHAAYQAAHCQQGHQGWPVRVQILQRRLGQGTYAEIAAESWPWQRDAAPEELGREAFHCWRRSRGHWSVASARHLAFGIDMCRGRNGVWYFCAIVKKGR